VGMKIVSLLCFGIQLAATFTDSADEMTLLQVSQPASGQRCGPCRDDVNCPNGTKYISMVNTNHCTLCHCEKAICEGRDCGKENSQDICPVLCGAAVTKKQGGKTKTKKQRAKAKAKKQRAKAKAKKQGDRTNKRGDRTNKRGDRTKRQGGKKAGDFPPIIGHVSLPVEDDIFEEVPVEHFAEQTLQDMHLSPAVAERCSQVCEDRSEAIDAQGCPEKMVNGKLQEYISMVDWYGCTDCHCENVDCKDRDCGKPGAQIACPVLCGDW